MSRSGRYAARCSPGNSSVSAAPVVICRPLSATPILLDCVQHRTLAAMVVGTALIDRLRAFEGRTVGPPQPGPDEVNTAMIRHWCEAIGDANPAYTDPAAAAESVHGGIVAPPTMLQAWVMRGLF